MKEDRITLFIAACIFLIIANTSNTTMGFVVHLVLSIYMFVKWIFWRD